MTTLARRVLPLTGAGLGGLLLAACGLLIGLEPPEARPLPPLGEGGAGGSVPDPCVHAAPPSMPPADDDGPSLPPFWLAIRDTFIGESGTNPAAIVPGFDLDGTCTCETRRPTARDGGGSCVPRGGRERRCDFDGGIDNEGERLFANFGQLFGARGFGQQVQRGRSTVLIYVANYNGRPNDLSVNVGIAASNGLYTADCDPTLILDDVGPPVQVGGLFQPRWSGCEQWHGDPDQFVGTPSQPATYIPRAFPKGYVRDSTLVVSGSFDIPLFFGTEVTFVQEPILVAPLDRAPSRDPKGPLRFRTKGAVIGGRLPLTDLARIAFYANGGGFFVCQQPGAYESVMSALCDGVDQAESATQDHADKPCKSMSFALRFDADPVDLDRMERTPPSDSPNPCQSQPIPPVDTICPP